RKSFVAITHSGAERLFQLRHLPTSCSRESSETDCYKRFGSEADAYLLMALCGQSLPRRNPILTSSFHPTSRATGHDPTHPLPPPRQPPRQVIWRAPPRRKPPTRFTMHARKGVDANSPTHTPPSPNGAQVNSQDRKALDRKATMIQAPEGRQNRHLRQRPTPL